jgi:hypothetical protein
MSKGSKPRKVKKSVYDNNFDSIFGKKEVKVKTSTRLTRANFEVKLAEIDKLCNDEIVDFVKKLFEEYAQLSAQLKELTPKKSKSTQAEAVLPQL